MKRPSPRSPLKGGEPVRGRKSPFKGDLEGLYFSFSFPLFLCASV